MCPSAPRSLTTPAPSEQQLENIPIGRSALLKELKGALLLAIGTSYGGMRRRIEDFVVDVDERLKRLPAPAQPTEKRRIFEAGLKKLEHTLSRLVGAGGRHQPAAKGKRSLRMQLCVDAAKQFEEDLGKATLQGDLVGEVEQLVNQSYLEQGGSFDSDTLFLSLSQKIIERFSGPCERLIRVSSSIVSQALVEASRQTFGEFPALEATVLETLGVNGSDPTGEAVTLAATLDPCDLPGTLASDGTPLALVGFLANRASDSVSTILDAFSPMVSCHPMWRNFDDLYHNVLKSGAESFARMH
jgi:hypothetical protein